MNNQQTGYYPRNLSAFIMRSKKALKLLFVNVCLRPDGFTKVLPVGLASVMTYFETKEYDFTLLDIDINEYDDVYVENYIKIIVLILFLLVLLLLTTNGSNGLLTWQKHNNLTQK